MSGIRDLWAGGGAALGGWLTIDSTAVAEAAGGLGLDYVCVDTQHGVSDYRVAMPMIQAVLLGGGEPIVRVPWNEPGIIGKMLDAGAHGVVVPMVNDATQARAAVAACRYPPDGSRSFGPVMANLRRAESTAAANERVVVAVMVETVEALANVREIVAVPGVDAVYVGPADLSLSLGLPPGNNDEHESFRDALGAIVTACDECGVVPGIHSTAALTPLRLQQGFRMITVTADFVAVRTKMADDLAQVRESPRAGRGEPGLY